MSISQYYTGIPAEGIRASPARAVAGAHESWVDIVRLLAAFLIVVVHGLNLDRRFQDLPVNSAAWLSADLLIATTRWALPIFVMISGYFLLDPDRKLDFSRYYRRRVSRIGWPLAAWTAVYLGVSACDDMLAGRPIAPGTMAGMVIKGAPYFHLWYLYMLPGLYLVAPFVKVATDHLSKRQLTAAVATCFAFTILSAAIDAMYSLPSGSYIIQFPRYLGYFLAGHLLGRVLPAPKPAIALAVLLVSALAAAAVAWLAAHLLSPAHAIRVFGFGNPAIIALSLAAFVLARRLPLAALRCTWLGPAADASLGIYLVHPAIIDALQHWNQSDTTSVLAVQGIIVFVVSLLLVLVMQRTPLLRRCV